MTYTSPHSMEVTVDVWAENTLTGTRRHTNSARLWYVAISSQVGPYEGHFKPLPVPELTGLTDEELAAGHTRYQSQKTSRAKPTNYKGISRQENDQYTDVPCSVPHSRTTLTNIVLPSDCTSSGHLMGGSLMKLMDTAAGIVSVRHCRTLAVTACLDAINFYSPIFNGDLVFVTGEVVFTSSKSLVIRVSVEAEGLRSGARRVTNDAYFTFVSLGKNGKAIPVPPLVLKTQDEVERYEEMKILYEAKKVERLREREEKQKNNQEK